MRDLVAFAWLDLRLALRARAVPVWLGLTLGALGLTLLLAPGGRAPLASIWFACVMGALALLLAAAGGALLPNDRSAGRAAWLSTLAPRPTLRRAGAAVAAAALALGVALLGGLLVGLLAPPLGLVREVRGARALVLPVERVLVEAERATLRLDLGASSASESLLELDLHGLAPRSRRVLWSAGAATGSAESPWRGRARIALPAGASEVRLGLGESGSPLVLRGAWLLGARASDVGTWLLVGLLCGLTAACLVPLAVGASRFVSAPTAAGVTLLVLLLAAMRSVLPEAARLPAGSGLESAARDVIGAALVLAPDLSALAAVARPAAGQALGLGDLVGLVTLLPYVAAWLLLLLLPLRERWGEEVV